MIYLYSGTPGSGKSLKMAQDIFRKLKKKENVIANFPIDTKKISKGLFREKRIGKFTYKNNMEITPDFLVQYAKENHKENKENQTLICIDEAQVIFNARAFNDKDRMKWITFFSQHRKLGYNVILVSQMDRMLDRQIRGLVETEYKHRKINNFKVGALLPFSWFIQVEYWYGVRERVGSQFFTYSKKYGSIYNTYELFE
jgi:zona occludens toxin